MQIPSQGIDPSWLYRPLGDIGIRVDPGITSVRIESAPDWKWDSWRDANGLFVRIRAIAAWDAELTCEFVRTVSCETRYLRFMAAVNELSPQTIDRLTRIDHWRDAALVATVNDRVADRVVGVGRCALNADEQSCAFAIVVADDWCRRGLGRHLMMLLVDTAAARGLNRIDGDVLAINRPMLEFVKGLGFEISASNDPVVQHVRLVLDRHRGRAGSSAEQVSGHRPYVSEFGVEPSLRSKRLFDKAAVPHTCAADTAPQPAGVRARCTAK